MAQALIEKSPPGTHIDERRRYDNETQKDAVGVEQVYQWAYWPSPPSASQVDIIFVSGGEEHSVTSFVGESSQDPQEPQVHPPADAVLNTDVEDFLRHIRYLLLRTARGPLYEHLDRVDDRYIRFRGKLIATLLDEPIEDGVTHPAEGFIDEALRAGSSDCKRWLSQVLIEYYPVRPSLCASIVRCIGRLDYDRVRRWGMRVVENALQNRDAEVREAAIRAIEAWERPEAIEMLRRHSDAEPWLNEYVQQVIVDLSGAPA